MSSVIRLSQFGKVAALTAAGGSLYVFRDEFMPYLRSQFEKPQLKSTHQSQLSESQSRIIDDLPEHVPYLLVGGGTASHSAMRAIRGHNPKAKVLIVSSENHTPYMRPALSKEIWFTEPGMRKSLNFKLWNGKEKSIYYEIDEFFLTLDKLVSRETGGVSIIKNMKLTRLDPNKNVAYLEGGQQIRYDKCLLAPGGKPKTLHELDNAPNEIKNKILYFRTADDFLELESISETAKCIVVIGGGFLGSELTCALASRNPDEKVVKDQKIYQIYPEPGNLSKVLPNYLSLHVSKKIEQEGANVIPDVEVRKISTSSDKSIDIELSNNHILNADYIVCAVGMEPDVELAKSSGLEVDEKTGGYLVNSELEARTNVWVAGDASCYYDLKLGRRRVEHHDHAVNSGKLAGKNMVEAGNVYTHQSMFWSDLGRDISFEAVGIIDSNLETVAVFVDSDDSSKSADSGNVKKSDQDESKSEQSSQITTETKKDDAYDKGVVFYLRDGVIVGILLWNLFSRLTIARRILSEQKKYDDFNEVAKMFNLYLDD